MSEINSRHAFLIYLTFEIKHGLRNLQTQNKNITAICEIDEGVEINNNVKIVDYECIGDAGNDTLEEGAQLVGLKGNKINLDSEKLKDADKTNSTYTDKDLPDVVFTILNNTLYNNTFTSKSFNFSFIGTLNQECENLTNENNIPLPINGIEENATCDFSKEQLNASLICSLEIMSNYTEKNLAIDNEITIKDIKVALNLSTESEDLTELQFYYEPLYIEQIIELTTDITPETDSTDQKRLYYKKSSSGSKAGMIVAIVIASVTVVGGLIEVSVYLLRIRKTNISNVTNISANIPTSANKNDTYVSDMKMIK